MSRHIRLATYLSVDDLEKRYRAAHEPQERTWWQILWLLAQGQTATATARSTGSTAAWIGPIAKRSHAEGPAGMVNRQHTTAWRAPRLLSAQALGRAAGGTATGVGGRRARGGAALDLSRGGRREWVSGWRRRSDARWPCSAAGSISNGSSSAGRRRARGMRWPTPTSRPRAKK